MSTKKTVVLTAITALTGGLFAGALSVQAVAKSDDNPLHPGFYRDRMRVVEVTTKRTLPGKFQVNTNNPLHPSYFTSRFTADKWVPTGEVRTAPYRDTNNPLQPGYTRN